MPLLAAFGKSKGRLIVWFLYAVLFGFLPALFKYLSVSRSGSAHAFRDTLGTGDLLLVAGGLAGAAVAEVFARPATAKKMQNRAIAAGLALLVTVACFYEFAAVSTRPLNERLSQSTVSQIIEEAGTTATATADIERSLSVDGASSSATRLLESQTALGAALTEATLRREGTWRGRGLRRA